MPTYVKHMPSITRNQSHFPFPASVPSLLQVKYPDGGFVSTYVKYMPPGIMMIIVFALLIPGFWFLAVHTNRTRLDVSGQLAAMLPVCVMLPCCLSCYCMAVHTNRTRLGMSGRRLLHAGL